MASQRQLRVGEEIKHILAHFLARGDWVSATSYPWPITITRVDISPDFSNALVFVMPLGGEEQEKAIHFLKHISGQLRKEVAQKVRLRRAPQLKFILDTTFDNADRISKIIQNVSKNNIES